MILPPLYSRHERAVVRRLRLLGSYGERAHRPRREFRDDLRDRLVAEAAARSDECLVGC